MTRFELLQLLVAQARANGFEFRKWYVGRVGLPWETTKQAVQTLCEQRRYYSLLFSHEFASSFWKPGERITFQVPTQTFTRKMADGTVGTVSRKGYTRRSAREDAWRYHLREMAVAEEPLRYMRKYLPVLDELDLDQFDPDLELEDDDTGAAQPQRATAPELVRKEPASAQDAPPRGLTVVPMRPRQS
jgi:hypothetical protein